LLSFRVQALSALTARPSSSSRHFFYQTLFKPISKRQFKTSEAMRILNWKFIAGRAHGLMW
jgi:hypothetical protein